MWWYFTTKIDGFTCILPWQLKLRIIVHSFRFVFSCLLAFAQHAACIHNTISAVAYVLAQWTEPALKGVDSPINSLGIRAFIGGAARSEKLITKRHCMQWMSNATTKDTIIIMNMMCCYWMCVDLAIRFVGILWFLLR